jgi:hypothetical protein
MTAELLKIIGGGVYIQSLPLKHKRSSNQVRVRQKGKNTIKKAEHLCPAFFVLIKKV